MDDPLAQFRELQDVVKGPRCGYQLLEVSEADRVSLDAALQPLLLPKQSRNGAS